MTFAALETAINTACASALANATAVIGAASVAVVFREAREADGGQVAGGFIREWTAEAPRAAWPAELPARGDSLLIDGVEYVCGRPDTDPTGWTVITVGRA